EKQLARSETRWEERFSEVLEWLDALDCTSGTLAQLIRGLQREQKVWNEHLQELEIQTEKVRVETENLMEPAKHSHAKATGALREECRSMQQFRDECTESLQLVQSKLAKVECGVATLSNQGANYKKQMARLEEQLGPTQELASLVSSRLAELEEREDYIGEAVKDLRDSLNTL
ncbi:hypothetical protein C8Q78DRAFT_928469, partial [Trametes maxima]